MGTDRNRRRARELADLLMSGGGNANGGWGLESIPPKVLGSLGEELAARYLEDRGYEVVERNYRCGEGEADLVVYDGASDQVVLVEVKTRRRGRERPFPEEAVTPGKRKTYRRIAYQFAAEHYPCPAIRFDVVAVTLAADNVGEIRHLYGAFDWEAGQ